MGQANVHLQSAAFLTGAFGLAERVAVVTGGSGVLGSAMALGLARAGAKAVILGRRLERAEAVAAEILAAGGEAMALHADVLQRSELEVARETILRRWGRIDILVNAAGGNIPAAMLGDDRTFFELTEDAFRQVVDLNLKGTVLPCQVFGAAMVRLPRGERRGSIINISSMAADRAMTRVVGYAAAKAAVENFTRWLAVDLARSHGAYLRVNALAPGFFLADQNRHLLVQEDGSPTPRGRAVIAHTPAGRFGEPQDLVSTLLWLCGPGSEFVTGVVVPVDGGFQAFSGI